MIKRIAFEITYIIMILICMPLFILFSSIMLIVEVFRTMPNNIFKMTYNMFYGKET